MLADLQRAAAAFPLEHSLRANAAEAFIMRGPENGDNERGLAAINAALLSDPFDPSLWQGKLIYEISMEHGWDSLATFRSFASLFPGHNAPGSAEPVPSLAGNHTPDGKE